MILKFLQGVFIGLAMILPGLSAGTVILILGFYRQFVDDLSTINLKPYLLMIPGAAGGILAGVFGIRFLLDHYSVAIMSFLMGMLLASVPMVINHRRSYSIRPWPVLLGAAGFAVTWFVICEPTRTFTVLPPGGNLHFLLGGTVSSATMLLPGVSGGSVLIILNLYDELIYALSSWQWLKLAFFSVGFVVGLFGLARLLSALYRRYQAEVSLLLAGMILGSTRALLPDQFTISFFIFSILGAALVLYFSLKHIRNESG